MQYSSGSQRAAPVRDSFQVASRTGGGAGRMMPMSQHAGRFVIKLLSSLAVNVEECCRETVAAPQEQCLITIKYGAGEGFSRKAGRQNASHQDVCWRSLSHDFDGQSARSVSARRINI